MTVEALLDEGARSLGLALESTQLAQLARYAGLVVKWNRVANLTGARRSDEFARKFVLDALAVAPHVQGRTVADLGSGAGLPGMVLAIVLPHARFHLVEPRARRARFLEQARIELGLDNVQVHCARGEDWQPPAALDVIISQAVGTLSYLLRVTARLRTPGTCLLALKGQRPTAEIAALGPDAAACEVTALNVPGWAARHLVRIDCAQLAAGA